MNHLIYITKADGNKELFEEQKLIDSLQRVGGTPEMIDTVVEKVESEIKEGMTTGEIYHHAFQLLRAQSMPIAVKYSLRRALSELGPDGFPFERFIAAIFRTWGYEAVTDQNVLGSCVSHEMDVVAWNEEKLIMCEAKFHNEFGLKSDVKVALYVKARFDDLKNTTFEYGGKKRAFTEGWLITNTKFTEQAIKYGECAGLKMIGWNYPQQGNLQQIIEQAKLHPFTCLSLLSNVHKRELLKRGVLMCKELTERPALLHEVGLDDSQIALVMQEIDHVTNAR